MAFVAINPASPGGSSIDGMVLRTSSDQPVSFFSFPEHVSPHTLMLSPGGRYLIAVNSFVIGHQKQIVAIDLTTGKVVGKAESQEPNESNELLSTAFSLDGKQLAILHRLGESELRITIIDTATGKRKLPLKIPGNAVDLLSGRLLSLRGVRVEMGWYSDHKHLFLFDGLVIDSTTGAIVTDQRLERLASNCIVGQSLIWKEVSGDLIRTRPFGATSPGK